MSTYYSVFDCQDCGFREFVGFVGEKNETPIYCSACRQPCLLCPPAGEKFLQTSLHHQLFVLSDAFKKNAAKRRRKRNRNLVSPWVATGFAVPIFEDLVEIGGRVFLNYSPRWESVPCPHCQRIGTLADFRSYLQHCPECHSPKMAESEL